MVSLSLALAVYQLSVNEVQELISGPASTPVSLWISSRHAERRVQTFSDYLESLNPR